MRRSIILREVNEAMCLLWADETELEFFCECDERLCDHRITLEAEEYLGGHVYPGCFLVAPGHRPARGAIATETDAYVVVRESIWASGNERRPARVRLLHS